MKRFILLLVTLFAMTNVMAQLQPDMPIPADKEVRVGRLENGMTYYIRHNEKPKGQASFYIFHHVGAVQEEDSQQGLAHFLEHMAFNGTKNLPGKKMIEYLERNGVKFGADLNAYTSYDETCYNLDNVPTANPATIDTALLILHDWSQFISLEPQEINNERGVIMEELRTRDGAGWRAMVRRNAAVNRGSKYEHREYFLPQLLRSAETMQTAFARLKPLLEREANAEAQKIIVVATVEGDIHDIGKNIVSLMLGNHGFKVVDLGKDVKAEAIVEAAVAHKADLIGLSALMTTTMVRMRDTVDLVKQRGLGVDVMVGGAVVTPAFAESIGANYSSDAVDAVRLAKSLIAARKNQ